jgi:hypothetical protein
VPTLLAQSNKSEEVEPTIITITVETNVSLWLTLSHPTFNHELKLAEGKTKVNVPYTSEPIYNWLYVHSKEVPKS